MHKIKDFVRSFFEHYSREKRLAVDLLHRIQEEFGFLDPMVLKAIVEELELDQAFLQSYDFFPFLEKEKGKRIYVCVGLSCALAGAKEWMARLKGRASPVSCFQMCHKAPCVCVDGEIMSFSELMEREQKGSGKMQDSFSP